MNRYYGYVVLAVAAAVAPFVIHAARAQDQEVIQPPVMPQPAEEAQSEDMQDAEPQEEMPESTRMPTEMMAEGATQPATTQSVAEEVDQESPQALRAATQRAAVRQTNRQTRTQGQTRTGRSGQPQVRTGQPGQPGVRGAASRPVSFNEVYGMLAQRNIFLKDRTAKPVFNTQQAGSKPGDKAPRTPEQALVLTMVAIDTEGTRAYFEDLTANSVKKVNIGESVGKGRLNAIQIDAIEYEAAGQRKWIEVGQDLTGHWAEPPPSYASSSLSPTSLPADLVGKDPNDPSLTPEQKMKLKRALEMQGILKK